MKRTSFAIASLMAACADAGDITEWKKRSVYQLLTDRFSLDYQRVGSGYPGSSCTDLSRYCGGTWKGIENNLDYIEGMGFDAI